MRLWAEKFLFWQNLVAGLWKLLFYLYRRALWRQTFLEGVLIFHPSRILLIFSLLLEKRLLEWLSTLQSTFTGERSGNVLVFKPFSINLGVWKFFPKTFVKDRIEQFLKLLSTFSQNFAVFFDIFLLFINLSGLWARKPRKIVKNGFAEISKVQYRVWKIISTVSFFFRENEMKKLSLWGSVEKYNWFLSK